MGRLSDRPQNRYIKRETRELKRVIAYAKIEAQKFYYYAAPKLCEQCAVPIPFSKRITHKYCSKSCAAKVNNKGFRRHGAGPNQCKICGELTANAGSKYCSTICHGISRRSPEDHKKRMRAAAQSRYRAKKYRVADPTADNETIKQIYLNCPKGYEVDHIIPVSKGGKHHQDNLQYLPIIENRRKKDKII
jgi:5-methylcytosine-specific restriction endonuclease McrA